MLSISCADYHLEFRKNALVWCQSGTSHNKERHIIKKIVYFKCREVSIENPSQNVMCQVHIKFFFQLTKSGRVPGLVSKQTTLFSTKIDSSDDLDNEVSDALQGMSIELSEIKKNNMFRSMQSITRDELIHLIEHKNTCCDDVVKSVVRNETLDNLKGAE